MYNVFDGSDDNDCSHDTAMGARYKVDADDQRYRFGISDDNDEGKCW